MILADQLPPPDGGDLGSSWGLYVGPAVIFLAIIFWVAVTLTASRVPPRRRAPTGRLSDRGPVQGGILQGSPSQRTRRDPAPSVTHRQVMAHIEQARAEEEALAEQARAEEEAVRRPSHRRKGRGRRRKRGLFGGRGPR
ncbi:hypothetical protein SAMN05443665_102782 [Actinomadura meyerae]|uniref:Uncharacterized protein n=1 Tax=Actinomadura meyerae TaxID=240840 RepID=A0A239MEJ5_9ACTN|nr:hypothetical protein [Actinomadura meyerae]SNT40552.1 hypothetical protein SAMN05443665_102782 [Actinomadura meyerae]